MATLVLAVLALAVPAGASASSLVYISGNNVWLANPDGSGRYQVTLDGTAANPYSSPSQANDGTIEAIRGSGSGAQLYRMAQNGTLRNQPFSTAEPTGPLDATISPDGSKVAFWGVTGTNPCYPFYCVGTASSYQVSYADHYVDPSTFAPGYAGWSSFGAPAWMGPTRNLLFTGSGTMWWYDFGTSEPQQWFQADPQYTNQWDGSDGSCCNISFEEGAVSHDGMRLAMVIYNTYPSRDRYQIAIFSANPGDFAQTPPVTPTLSSCVINPPDGSNGSGSPGGYLFDSLSWSPDDSSLAYEYKGAIYVVNIASLTNCAQDGITQVIAAGTDPFWGPANVNPGQRGTGGTGGNGGTGGTGGNGGTQHPPGTRLIGSKVNRHKHRVTFTFRAVGSATGFRCAPIRFPKHGPAPQPHYASCSSPKSYSGLRPARYEFLVRAFNRAGTDPHPAHFSFKI